MVDDIYAIFESYKRREPISTGGSIGTLGIDHTNRGNVALKYRPNDQGSTFGDLGEGEEVLVKVSGPVHKDRYKTKLQIKGKGTMTYEAIQQQLAREIESLKTKAGLGDYSAVVFNSKEIDHLARILEQAKSLIK